MAKVNIPSFRPWGQMRAWGVVLGDGIGFIRGKIKYLNLEMKYFFLDFGSNEGMGCYFREGYFMINFLMPLKT